MPIQIPPVTLALIVANVVIYLAGEWLGQNLLAAFALWPPGSFDSPYSIAFHPWQMVTYAFLHGGGSHLFFNMFALFMFGGEIERLFGPKRFLVYYFVCVIGAAALHLAVLAAMHGPNVPMVGASGGVYGVLLAFGMAFPHRRILLLFPPIPMPAWVLVTAFGVLALVMGVTGTAQGIAHFAHLGGMAAGFVLIQLWRAKRRS